MLNRAFVKSDEPPLAGKANEQQSATDASEHGGTAQRVQVNDGQRTQWLQQEDIFCVEAAGNYVCFHTKQGQLISRDSLKRIEDILDQSRFIRVSRSNIVNVNTITASRRVSRSKVELTLRNELTVPIGPTYWAEIKSRLEL